MKDISLATVPKLLLLVPQAAVGAHLAAMRMEEVLLENAIAAVDRAT